MSVLSWLSPKIKRLESEKNDLRVEVSRAVIEFEHRRGEVERAANDVMQFMQRKGGKNEKT